MFIPLTSYYFKDGRMVVFLLKIDFFKEYWLGQKLKLLLFLEYHPLV